jgi:hypothetical protein
MKFLIMISPAVQTVYQCMKEYVVQHLTDSVAVLNTMHDIAEILLKLAFLILTILQQRIRIVVLDRTVGCGKVVGGDMFSELKQKKKYCDF